MQNLAIMCGKGRDTFIAPLVPFLRKQYNVHTFQEGKVQDMFEMMKWADISWFEWLTDMAIEASQLPHVCRNIVRLHKYEAFTPGIKQIDWRFVDDLVLVSKTMETTLETILDGCPDGLRVHVIPNGLELDRFPFVEHKPGKKIAWVGIIHARKNLAMALFIVKALQEIDPTYELHIAGIWGDDEYRHSVETVAANMHIQNVEMHGWVENIGPWLASKDYLLSVSLHEAHPYNIMEAMAMGIRPVVLHFDGAEDFYPKDCLFTSVSEAVKQVTDKKGYKSKEYRQITEGYSIEKQVDRIFRMLEDE